MPPRLLTAPDVVQSDRPAASPPPTWCGPITPPPSHPRLGGAVPSPRRLAVPACGFCPGLHAEGASRPGHVPVASLPRVEPLPAIVSQLRDRCAAAGSHAGGVAGELLGSRTSQFLLCGGFRTKPSLDAALLERLRMCDDATCVGSRAQLWLHARLDEYPIPHMLPGSIAYAVRVLLTRDSDQGPLSFA